jgi:hypothetical protein
LMKFGTTPGGGGQAPMTSAVEFMVRCARCAWEWMYHSTRSQVASCKLQVVGWERCGPACVTSGQNEDELHWTSEPLADPRPSYKMRFCRPLSQTEFVAWCLEDPDPDRGCGGVGRDVFQSLGRPCHDRGLPFSFPTTRLLPSTRAWVGQLVLAGLAPVAVATGRLWRLGTFLAARFLFAAASRLPCPSSFFTK